MVISFKVHLSNKHHILDLQEMVDALALSINIQLEKYKFAASHKWSFSTGGH